MGDGRENCLERAVNHAQAGDDVVLLNDRRDDSGHAVVRHADGTVSDPNSPDKRYDSLQAYRAEHPHYVDPVSLSDSQAEAIVNTSPGPERDALIRSMGLDGIADRRVADSEVDRLRRRFQSSSQRASTVQAAAAPAVEEARKARQAADSAQGFADYAAADAASLGLSSGRQKKAADEADTVRRERLPALKRTGRRNRDRCQPSVGH